MQNVLNAMMTDVFANLLLTVYEKYGIKVDGQLVSLR